MSSSAQTTLCCALLLGSALASCDSGARAPDVLLISLDSVRADSLRFDDANATPRLAELAQRGVVFEQALTGSSWTLPGHAQMFTGRPPLLHGVQLDDLLIDPRDPTLPELLQDGGWFGAGLWTGWYLAGDYGFARGFDIYENRMTGGPELDRAFHDAVEDGDLLRARALTNTRDISSHRDITSENVVQRASEILDVAPSDQPLFLFAHLFDPHYDYVPPAPHDTRFDPDYSGAIDGEDFYLNPAIWDAGQSPPRQISARDLEHVRALYQGEIAWTDQALGQLFDAWAEVRDFDNTLIIVTSDHGEEFFEHGGRGHRHTLFDEVLRVPLLVVPPGGASAARRAQQVDLSDLMPTVLDYCGLEAPAGVTGRSLRGLLEGADAAGFDERASLSSLLLPYQLGDEPLNYQLQDCLRTPQEKLVRVLTLDEERRRLVCERALWYDLVADPRERAPVTDRQDPRLAAAWTRLEAELDSLRQLHDGEEVTSRDDRGTAVRALFSGELGHLGYGGVDGADSVGLSMPWPPGPHPPVER